MSANVTTMLFPKAIAGVLGSLEYWGLLEWLGRLESGIWGTGILGMLGRAGEDGQSGAKSVPFQIIQVFTGDEQLISLEDTIWSFREVMLLVIFYACSVE
ncbi:hypothetical protein EDC04DRAFT_2898146 [Pisolithus marmoratus]|nr:hypothetical protein EDC04DRAFT_2898146 [Pisolithus marmoratus]